MAIMSHIDFELQFLFEFITDTDAGKALLISIADKLPEVVPNALMGGVPHGYVEFVDFGVVVI